jgi:NADH-quinone oxidoreductase subunit M
MNNFPLLSLLLLLPLFGAMVVLFIKNKTTIKVFSSVIMVITFLISLLLFCWFNPVPSGMQFLEEYSWIPTIGASYKVGIDGVSLLLILLTTFLSPIALISAWKSIEVKIKEFCIAMLVLEIAMLGVFMSLDILLFYFFWELSLIPMFLIILIWGGERKTYASIKFFLYTMFGSVLMLVGILVLYFINYNATGTYTFDLLRLTSLSYVDFKAEAFLFLTFFVAFAIKVPIFPFHTWLPDAHVEAPTAGSVILAGVLLKMGGYGIIRFCLSLFPKASVYFSNYIIILAIIGIIYGALMALVQKDLKRLIAYSSVSHLGFCILGIFSFNKIGFDGAVLQMVNHGLSTGALFLIVGMIYERMHTRKLADFGGIKEKAPVLNVLFLIVMLSSLGLPGTNGFIGEFLIILGAFQSNKIFAALSAIGIILAAFYLLNMFKKVMHGEITNEKIKNFVDVNAREIILLLLIIVLIFWIGIYPNTFLSKISGGALTFL